MSLPYQIISISDRLVPYSEALEMQESLQQQRRRGEVIDTLILVEHTPVVTIGRSSHRVRDFLTSVSDLQNKGIEVHESDRGGELTYHAPGQLVGYPVLELNGPHGERDLHKYLRKLEEVVIDTLRDLGLVGGRKEGLTGVWLGNDKIAAIGIKVSRWVTMHGFALNIDLDLTPMRSDIVPCGITKYGVTSLRERGVTANRSDVERMVVTNFERVLDRHAVS
jgi:lipoyl(octanoyl) transferase